MWCNLISRRAKEVEDEGKTVVEDAPALMHCTPIMGSIDGAKWWRNHTTNKREYRRGQEIELAALGVLRQRMRLAIEL